MERRFTALIIILTIIVIAVAYGASVLAGKKIEFPYDFLNGSLVTMLGVFLALKLERRMQQKDKDEEKLFLLLKIQEVMTRNLIAIKDVKSDIDNDPEIPTKYNLDLVFLELTSPIRYQLFNKPFERDLNWNIDKGLFQFKALETKIQNTQFIRNRSKVKEINEEILEFIEGKQFVTEDVLNVFPLLVGLYNLIEEVNKHIVKYKKKTGMFSAHNQLLYKNSDIVKRS